MAQMEKDWRTDYNWMDPNDLPVTDDDLNEPIRDIDLEKMIGVPGSGEQSGIMSAAENTDMAGMGKVMQMFQSDYGFDRDGFEENYIQFLDYRDNGGDMGIVEFTLNAFDMVKKQEKAPSIKMASETPEEEFDLMQMQEEMQLQEELKKQLEEDKKQMAANGGRMGYKYGTPMEARKAADLEDKANYREQGAIKAKEGKPKTYKMDVDKIKMLIKKAKEDKEKKAKGGIAGVL